MKITSDRQNDYVICKIAGEINLNTSPQLRGAFDVYLRDKITKVVVDFSEVPYVDSSGLATLIELFQRLRKTNGTLRICSVSEKVKNVFEITKLHKLFDIYDDLEGAREQL